ncbi:DMAP1, partial [Symbiodinium sp. KB8]
AWRPIHSSARRDTAGVHHWERATAEYPDYPFARFNKRVEVVRYTDEEYRTYLADYGTALTAVEALSAAGQRRNLTRPMDGKGKDGGGSVEGQRTAG